MEKLKVKNTGYAAFLQIPKDAINSLGLSPDSGIIVAAFEKDGKHYVCGLHEYRGAIHLNMPIFGDDFTTPEQDGLKYKQPFKLFYKKTNLTPFVEVTPKLEKINISMVKSRPYWTLTKLEFIPLAIYRVSEFYENPNQQPEIEIFNQL